MMTIGSLFSGIGGIEIGLERTGEFKTIWQCEIEPYPSAVLKKHWPNVPNLGDITKVNWNEIERPDVLCGGFPCQDISIAGKRKGIKEGTRSGLFFEFAKAIRILRPKYVLIENVSALALSGLNIVLAELAALGYDAEWEIISARECGALHRRERLFIIAYANRVGHLHGEPEEHATEAEFNAQRESLAGVHYSYSENIRFRGGIHRNGADGERIQEHKKEEQPILRSEAEGCNDEPKEGIAPDYDNTRHTHGKISERKTRIEGGNHTSDTRSKRIQRNWKRPVQGFPEFSWCKDIRRIEDLRGRPDIPEPLVRRENHGISSRVERYMGRERRKAMGNSVVPACALIAGMRILELNKNGK